MAFICRTLDKRFTLSFLFRKFSNLTHLEAACSSNFLSLSRHLVPFTLIQRGLFQTLWCITDLIFSVHVVATTLRCSVNYSHTPTPLLPSVFLKPLFFLKVCSAPSETHFSSNVLNGSPFRNLLPVGEYFPVSSAFSHS